MNSDDRETLDQLLHGELSGPQHEAALKLLETDREAVAYYSDQAILLSDLRQSLRRRHLQRGLPVGATRKKSRWFRFAWGAAAAAALVVISFVLWQSFAGISVEVVEAQGLNSDWNPGRRRTVRTLSLDTGRLQLKLPKGVLVTFEAPFDAEFVSDTRVRLRSGKAMVDVGSGGKGFSIVTTDANVIDLGTKFGVSVSPASATDVVVYEGSVDVFPPGSDGQSSNSKLTLAEGEGIRVSASSPARRLPFVPLGKDGHFPEAANSADLISDITDNIVAGQTHRFYGLIRGGMRDGARVYTTGHFRLWRALVGEAFPQELVGADAICTFSPDRNETGLEITLTLKRPCNVFVLADASTPVPDWLKRDFTDTGLRVRSGPWVPRGKTPESIAPDALEKMHIVHAVWKKTVATPGAVVLGSPRAREKGRAPVMYGIAVKELNP